MLAFLRSLIDLILPRKARMVRAEAYTLSDIRVAPEMHEACGTHITTLTTYRDPVVADLVRTLKYDHDAHAADLLAEVLSEYLREEIPNLRSFSAKPIILVPIPLHHSRTKERGFNQVEKILNALPREFKDGTLARVENVLARTRATAHQTRLSRAERLRNVVGVFALAKKVEPAHYILIDDVTTTGATLSEAARPLSQASTTLIALARA
jgi:ComF family protein